MFSATLWAVLVAGSVVLLPGAIPPAAAAPADFVEVTAFSGLTNPTVVRFAPDGRVFVAEKSGLIKVFDNLADQSATVFADLRTNVHNFWDRGLLGMALPPGFPANPYVYVMYTHDAPIGGTAPRWGSPGATSDGCPTPPGPTEDGCVVSSRLSRLRAAGNVMAGPEQVLVEDWCQQFSSHSAGTIEFGPDGMLYASAGDGASFTFADFGQEGAPPNPCGDPPGGPGATLTPPSAQGGTLRSQDAKTMADPMGLDGTVIRVDPETGAGVSGNPMFASTDANARRILAFGLRNPFRMAVRPDSNELWVGDVGWNTWEEINRLPIPQASAPNFGWPCYEGAARQAGYDSINLDLCEYLYLAGPSAVTPPAYAYDHNAKVVPGDACPTGSSSISGVAFEPSGGAAYPPEYQGAMFFADYSRRCIWVMTRGADGLPNRNDVRPFQTPATGPVNLEFSPAGELFYPAFEEGTIKRIVYTGTSVGPCPAGQFKAEYFVGMTPGTAPALSGCEPGINHDWGMGGPGAGVPVDQFSARWTGTHPFAVSDTYEFTVTADDGVRLWVDDQLLIDQWRDQSASTYTARKALTAGNHTVRVEYFDNGVFAVAQVAWKPTSPQTPTCATNQFKAEYFAGITPGTTPVVALCEDAIAHPWGPGGPGSGVPVEQFSARWTGTHAFPATDTYQFTATADDGVRLWVDDQLLIDQWRDQSATAYTATVHLDAGNHTIRVEYYDNTNDATAQLSWAPTSPQAPTAIIDEPTASTRWGVGSVVFFAGRATDQQQGTLPPSALTWTLVMRHCPGTCHSHPIQTFTGVATGSFVAPDHDYPSHLELVLTATDAQGNTSTEMRRIEPATVDVAFRTEPEGLSLSVNGVVGTTPFTRTLIAGSNVSVTATSPQLAGGAVYRFSSWSDGGAGTHNLAAPREPTVLTATFTPDR